MGSKKRKICIVTEYLSYIGGGERVYCNWANMFADILGHDVTIVSMEDWDKPFFPLSNKVKIHSLKLRRARFYDKPIARRLSMITNFINDRIVIKKYLIHHNYDVVLGIATNINLLLATISISGIRIATEHTEYFAPNILLRKLRQLLYPRFNVITVLNYDDQGEFLKCNIPTRVMLNPVDLSIPIYPNVPNKTIISIGSLSTQKNQKQLLDIMKIVHSKHPDWILKIYGQGPLLSELIQYANNIGVQRCVRFEGATNDVYRELSNASIFALTSIVEGLGLVIIEAMHAGVPCVCFDARGPKMIIDNGENGYLIPMGDIDNFANMICKLIEDEHLRQSIGDKGQRSVSKYNIQTVASDWKNLFDNVLY